MMSNEGVFELRGTPGIGASFRSQLYLLAVSRRWGYVPLALLAILGLVWLLAPSDGPSLTMLASAVASSAVAVFWAIAVWHGEGPRRRTYHWSLPVARPAHDLVRVAVGAVYLLAAFVVLALAGAAVTGLAGREQADLGAVAWANYFAAPLIVYLLTMPLALWSEYRITRWCVGVLFALPPAFMVLGLRGVDRPLHWLDYITMSSDLSLGNAVFTVGAESLVVGRESSIGVETWAGAAALWFGIGLACTAFAAVFRPDDLRRLVRGRGSDGG